MSIGDWLSDFKSSNILQQCQSTCGTATPGLSLLHIVFRKWIQFSQTHACFHLVGYKPRLETFYYVIAGVKLKSNM